MQSEVEREPRSLDALDLIPAWLKKSKTFVKNITKRQLKKKKTKDMKSLRKEK